MLRELRIKNFAVIDEATLELNPGLDVLTGETGAGKTIVLNALGLILGGRVGAEIIRHEKDEATVEALFDAVPEAVREKLSDGGYGAEDELVVKRIVSRSGKNRVYVNGSLCPLNFLSELGPHLIHIYGQHEHYGLLRAETHLKLLDAHGGLDELAGRMRDCYQEFKSAWEGLRQSRENLQRARQEEELLRAQAEEISRASLHPGEEEELKARRNVLIHAEKLDTGCREGTEILYESEDALVSRLGRYLPRLQELAAIDNTLNDAAELLQSSLAQLEEAASALRAYANRVEFDPQALERVDDRIEEIQRLKRKYNGSVVEILATAERIERDLAALDRGTEESAALQEAFEKAREAAWGQAEALSTERRRVAKRFQKGMESELASLGMTRTKFVVQFLAEEGQKDEPPFILGGRKITEEGTDRVEFYFSPNPGEAVRPLARIASGGELSRLMLAVKALVLTPTEIPTLLFDEVDAGIGGRIAEMVGKKLKKVAAAHQVICVTHLPQIAALANSHYVVAKETAKGRTFTRVRQLTDKEKINEVARMLGGITVTEQARRHAEEMIKMQGGNIKDKV